MLIMSLHQGISNWSTSASEAWNKGNYCSALLYSIIARIISVAGFVFQICYLPIHLIGTIQSARQAYAIHKIDSTFLGIALTIKTVCLGVSILILGTCISALSIFIPEVMYGTAGAQKLIYSGHIITQVDSHPGIESNTLQSIHQHLNESGFKEFDEYPFQDHFRSVWKRNAIWKNAVSEFGEPDIEKTMQRSLENAVAEYVVKQLQALQHVDPVQYQEILQRLPQTERQQPTPQAVAQQLKSHYSPETLLIGNILFSHMQNASRDLVYNRKCFTAEDLELKMGGSYYAVVGMAIFNMISGSKVLNPNDNPSVEVSSGIHTLTLDSRNNIFNLLEGFIDLNTLMTQLQNGRQGSEKALFEECHNLLTTRLAYSENKSDNEKIEARRKALDKKNKTIEELETKIFKQIGTLIEVMNRRIISLASLNITWSQAFTV